MVGSARRGRAKHDSTRRLPVESANGEILKQYTAFVEDAELLGKENASLTGWLLASIGAGGMKNIDRTRTD